MTAELTITPESNIDEAEQKVNDIGQVRRITRDWKDIVAVFDVKANEADTVPVSHISLFDHRLILDGVRHRMLHMLSLNSMTSQNNKVDTDFAEAPVKGVGCGALVRVPWSAAEDEDLRWWYGAANGAMTSYRHMSEELNRRYHDGKPVRTISAVCRRDGHVNYGKPWGRHSNAAGDTPKRSGGCV